jgi:hypothetical protein
MENKPFVVIKIEQVYPSQNEKGFYAHFKLIICVPETKFIKDFNFKISVESYDYLSYVDKIISGKKISTEDEIINEIQNCIFENVKEFPIQIKKSGNNYDWYIFSKMIEICEKV